MSIVSAVTAISPLVIVLTVSTTILGMISFVYYDKHVKIKKYAYLVEMMAKAENKGGTPKPLAVVVDRSGMMIPFISEPDDRNKGLLKNDNYTLINPDLVKPSARLKFFRGPEMLFYPLPGYFPLNIHSSAALIQLAQDFRENKYFNWIPNEIDVLSLLFNGTNTLYEDCLTVINNAAKFGNEIPEFLLNDDYEEDEEVEYEEIEEEAEEEIEETDLLSEIANDEEVKTDE